MKDFKIFDIKKVEYYITEIEEDVGFFNFCVNFYTYDDTDRFYNYIKKQIKLCSPDFTQYITKKKDFVYFGVTMGGLKKVPDMYKELLVNCKNKTYLLMLRSNTKDWLYNMFLEILFKIDIQECVKWN